jgi:hypothetical protein
MTQLFHRFLQSHTFLIVAAFEKKIGVAALETPTVEVDILVRGVSWTRVVPGQVKDMDFARPGADQVYQPVLKYVVAVTANRVDQTLLVWFVRYCMLPNMTIVGESPGIAQPFRPVGANPDPLLVRACEKRVVVL